MADPRGHGTIQAFKGRDFYSPTLLPKVGGGGDYYQPPDTSNIASSAGFDPFGDNEQTLFPKVGGGSRPDPNAPVAPIQGSSTGLYNSLPNPFTEDRSPRTVTGYLGASDDSWLQRPVSNAGERIREGAGIPITPPAPAPSPWKSAGGYADAPWGSAPTALNPDAFPRAQSPQQPATPEGDARWRAPQQQQPARQAGPVGPRVQRTAGSGGYYGA